jgi:uncharacterized membrane protein (UPF0127 family)
MRKFLTLFLLFFLCACQSESRDPLKYVELITPAGDTIKTSIVYKGVDQQQGLSGIQDADFKNDQGMLFFYLVDDEKNFWMPDTYFDLDIIFLNPELKILDIIRKLPHYIGRNSPELIPRGRPVWARHALELKATSGIAQKLKIGDQLTWKSSLNLKDTEEQIRKLIK